MNYLKREIQCHTLLGQQALVPGLAAELNKAEQVLAGLQANIGKDDWQRALLYGR